MIPAKVRHTVESRGLLTRGDHVLVACSGGPDSVVLTHVLGNLASGLGIDVSVASVDHGLRREAKDDVAVARAVAASLALPFHALAVQVDADGESLQAAAREARYGALRALAADIGARVVAVGHTMDDQAETVLDRILRGAGVRGLSGILPKREDGVVRPLIDCRRADVLAYAAHHGLGYAKDRSNHDPRFRRVRIRSALLPAMEAEDPEVATHLSALADEARDLRAWVDSAVSQWLAAACVEGPGPGVAGLRLLHPALRRPALAAWVHAKTGQKARRPHLHALEGILTTGGEVLLGGGFSAQVRGESLVIEHRAPWRARGNRGATVPCGPQRTAPQD